MVVKSNEGEVRERLNKRMRERPTFAQNDETKSERERERENKIRKRNPKKGTNGREK